MMQNNNNNPSVKIKSTGNPTSEVYVNNSITCQENKQNWNDEMMMNERK